MTARIRFVLARMSAIALAVGALVVTSGASTAAVVDQFTFFDASSLTHASNKYLQPTTAGPTNWVSPTNYTAGRMYLRLEVLSRPSTKALDVQICVWRNSYSEESCSPTARLVNAGVQWVDLGAPANWWKKGGTWSWASAFSPTRLMVKDVASGKLLMSANCGASCYPGSDLASHVPIVVKASAIVVAPGATLQPPSSWAGCPTAWSPQCGGGGAVNLPPVVEAGPAVSATVGTPVSLAGSITDDGLPAGSSITASWSKQSGPGTVTFAPASAAVTSATFSAAGSYVVALTGSDGARSATDTTTVTVTPGGGGGPAGRAALIANSTALPSADRPLRARLESLGYAVTVIDDDVAGTTAFSAFDLVVVSSSVVPTKVPTSLAGAPVPLLNLEAFATTRLLLGAGGSEVSSQQSADVIGTHPATGGLRGRVPISASTAFGRATPPPSATVVARLAGRSDVMAYVIDTGAALSSGVAPARRAAFLTGYNMPPLMNANAWSIFDATVRWIDPLVPTSPDPWHIAGLTRRQVFTVDPAGVTRTERLVAVPFVGNVGGVFDPTTIRVVEVDGVGTVVDDAVPIQFDRSATFDPSSNPAGELVVQLEGTTSGVRRYHVYYGAIGAPVSTPPPSAVTLDPNAIDEGHPAYRITTPSAEWSYHTVGGGFSSLVDPVGNDWLQWNATFGSAGTYRGIPNAVYPAGYLHPGFTNSTTELLASGPLRVSFRSTSSNGAFVVRWDVSALSATMTVLRADTPYWFLYEGTPGGQIDATSDKVIRANGTVTNLADPWTADVPGEWVGFADTVRDRSLFVSQVTDDSIVDSYRLMENNMTVFGFGRQGTTSLLTGLRQFVVGLGPGSNFAAIQPWVLSETRPVSAVLAAAEVAPA